MMNTVKSLQAATLAVILGSKDTNGSLKANICSTVTVTHATRCRLTNVSGLTQSKRVECVSCCVLVVELCWCSTLATYLRALCWYEPCVVCDALELNNLDGHGCGREAWRPRSKPELRWWLLLQHGLMPMCSCTEDSKVAAVACSMTLARSPAPQFLNCLILMDMHSTCY